MCLSKERAARQGYGKRRGTFETMLEVVGSCIRRLQKPGFYFVCSVCVEGALQDLMLIFLFLFSIYLSIFICIMHGVCFCMCVETRVCGNTWPYSNVEA